MIDAHPLAQAFLAHRAVLLRYLQARGARDEAEDLLQDLWLKLGEGADATIADHRAYLFRMAHNLMLDRVRSAQRRRHREDEYGGDRGTVDEAPAGIAPLIARERLDQVERVLTGLGERTDRIFRMHRMEELPQRSIAERLDISLSAVEKHLQKAYRALAAYRLGEQSGEPAIRTIHADR
ncbi:RNA polymerase sigma factor [Sphingomonas sp. KR1UV-12]|uniref:RNA polymerase sigma factor n=1 Tax=Sphingomonas aurea TaxID=3063994 RepID=A0ABT9ELC4_9SPHN|nr:RNA polymerase sigma factor [Sphingomonas sp. KR1UV-12]MDP1027583.1 RNA polymerase sigma factor [Sphingomonas sp. KR1UV-12]